MTDYIPEPQITVLDAGGQYCHLITRKVRDLGVYAEVRDSDTPASQLCNRKGLIISGGPSSVYEPDSPTVDPAIYEAGPGVLGICYGLQLMARHLGGTVQKGDKGEYGLAWLKASDQGRLLKGIASPRQRIWMSHKDLVSAAPPGFAISGGTDTCAVAVIEDADRKLYGVQFHPEVVHTECGSQVLSNFLFDVCGCERDWDPAHRTSLIEKQIREAAGDRKVFFFVSGGVDSTVAYTLCLRALGPERVFGVYVDTGLMREGETAFVQRLFASLGATHFAVEDASERFLRALDGVRDPEQKRRIIGTLFVDVQESILERGHFLDSEWILGQGTIYPDTIESGGSKKADLIKTHHNRVEGIQKLIDAGRIVEPLSFFYKDEVREIGRELGLPDEFLERHPFPGPALAIRCLAAESDAPVRKFDEGWLVPIRSVGVQGDSRSYRAVLALDHFAEPEAVSHLTNRLAEINRVIACSAAHVPIGEMQVSAEALTAERLARLRRADAIVRRISHDSGFDRQIWQFPVILIPLGTPARPDSVVLRPVDSVDGMTAQAVRIPEDLLRSICEELLRVEGICGVFCDLTNKPPGTIEWE